jgi:hypothetical protein
LPAAVTRLVIGSSETANSAYLNGWIRNVSYYKSRLSNAKLQSITT